MKESAKLQAIGMGWIVMGTILASIIGAVGILAGIPPEFNSIMILLIVAGCVLKGMGRILDGSFKRLDERIE